MATWTRTKESIQRGIETRRRNGNFVVSEETRKKMSTNSARNKPWLGKSFPEEIRKKMSESAKNSKNSGRFKKGHEAHNKGKKGIIKQSEETKKKRADSLRGKKRTEETKKKMRESAIASMKKGNRKFFDTDIERMIERMLKENEIHFLKQVPIKGIALVDFYLPDTKTIVECDGDYWHSKPEVQKRDKEKTKLFTELGYKVIRLKGSCIKRISSEQLKIICQR